MSPSSVGWDWIVILLVAHGLTPSLGARSTLQTTPTPFAQAIRAFADSLNLQTNETAQSPASANIVSEQGPGRRLASQAGTGTTGTGTLALANTNTDSDVPPPCFEASSYCVAKLTFSESAGVVSFRSASTLPQCNGGGSGNWDFDWFNFVLSGGTEAVLQANGTSYILTPSATAVILTIVLDQGDTACTSQFKVLSGSLLGVTNGSTVSISPSSVPPPKPVTAGSASLSTGTDSGSCFPGSAVVYTSHGRKLMRQLALGDEVLTMGAYGAPVFEEVYMFSHRSPSLMAEFMTLLTDVGANITASPGHYIWVWDKGDDARRPVRAQDINVGDRLVAVDQAVAATVTGKSSIKAMGLFNPHTASGSIVVDGICALTFTDTLPPSLIIHSIVTMPARLMYLAFKMANALPFGAVVNDMLLSAYFNAPSITRQALFWVGK